MDDPYSGESWSGPDSTVLQTTKAPLQTDSSSVNGVLDSLYGTTGKALDLWGQWQNAKTQNTAAKASLPSPVTTNSTVPQTVGGMDTKKLGMWAAIGAGVLVLVIVLTGRRRSA